MKALKKFKQVISLILQPTNVVFKVVELFFDKSERLTKVRYQAIGKQVNTVESVQSLVESLIHVQGFSDKDSNAILKAHKTEIYSSLSLRGVIFSDKKISLQIFDRRLNDHFTLPIDKIRDDIEFFRCFDEIDTKSLIELIFKSLCIEENYEIKKLSDKKISSKLVYLNYKN